MRFARSEANDAFELVGQGVRVLSENEMLAEQGQRVHTGQSDPLNRQFAESFTAHFAELAKKYPVYGELRNIFDLAMAVALIQSEGLAERVGWKPTLLASGEKLRLPQGRCAARGGNGDQSPRDQSAARFVAGVSGGVMVAPGDVLRKRGLPRAPARRLSTQDRRRRTWPLKPGGGTRRTWRRHGIQFAEVSQRPMACCNLKVDRRRRRLPAVSASRQRKPPAT